MLGAYNVALFNKKDLIAPLKLAFSRVVNAFRNVFFVKTTYAYVIHC